jgi:hypothetical protein
VGEGGVRDTMKRGAGGKEGERVGGVETSAG